jgi:menaquinone-dependent protoporphyrinogen oxidase
LGKKEATMNKLILVAYATKHGSTRSVAESVAETVRKHGFAVDVRPAATVSDISPYDGVVLGGALYMGRWHHDATHFLERYRDELAELPVAVFAMGPGTLEDNDVARSRAQLDKALSKVPEVEPVALAIFGGVVDPSTLHFPLNHMPATDARDWEAIEAWSEYVAAALRVLRYPPPKEEGELSCLSV